MNYENRLIPVMREGVDVIKMIFFKKLRAHLSRKYPDRETLFIRRLDAAIINELFGTQNTAEPFASFARENRAVIVKEMENIATEFPEMRIPLTDALRVQFLCDYQEGIDSQFILSQARELNILLVDRDVPLPAHFLNLVRKLGSTLDIIVKPEETK